MLNSDASVFTPQLVNSHQSLQIQEQATVTSPPNSLSTSEATDLFRTATVTTAVSTSPVTVNTSEAIPSISGSSITGSAQHPSILHLQPPVSTHAVQFINPNSQITGDTQPRFPSTSTRQRSSNVNVNVNNAEQEFLQTAIGACRSTISQQEAELKRLRECLEIRNKRILNLESQVGHASDFIASRGTTSDVPEDKLKAVADKLDEISRKLEQQQSSHPANNIVFNSCHPGQLLSKQHTSSQTDHLTEFLNVNPGPEQNVDEQVDQSPQAQKTL